MSIAAIHAHRTRRPGSRRQRVRQAVVFLEVASCLCVVGFFIYAFYHFTIDSPRYRVQHIVVYGASAVTPADVRQAAGVTTADNLLFLNRIAVGRRVAQLPYVLSAEVQRELPNTLIINLKEREAVATLVAGRRSYLLDRQGVILEEMEPGATPVGPLITNVPDLGVLTVGEQLNPPALREALALWEAYAKAPIAREVSLSEISAEGPMNLTMFWDEAPYEVRWGRSDYEVQAERLSILWREKAGQLPCQEYLDLRFDQDLVCR